ncbi:TIGR01777 family oxidoreductase [Thiovibrio frasassiensis]|uniref:TIGR01777 family oxidoreductase n=1 Tax=Thiovibrio frasassiensis TaxID=2984131 RepID=A0A9X4MHE5_9BACT|nr:TIGR01777 family oxidoreductase [Thiovibrio frasassiensis]MDG4476682.1 TIGR01777 family oxidoreductase [Thiovibrio frasassiensis]
MKVFIAGGTGFLGQAIIRKLLQEGHSVTALARSPDKLGALSSRIRLVPGSPLISGPWQEEAPAHDVIINLTGTDIFTRWTSKKKQQILASRIVSTRNIVAAIPAHSPHPITFINTSASGFYGFCGDEEKLEDGLPGRDFLATVCTAWEQEANKAKEKARVICMRIGIVLGKNGGALAKMLPGFRLGVAGKLGHGRQWFPWIHLDDLTRAILFCMQNSAIQGPVNLSAPTPVRNSEFTGILGRILHRPTFLAVPGFSVRLVLGELSGVVLEGCRMLPGVLLKNGFRFNFPEAQAAIEDIVGKS